MSLRVFLSSVSTEFDAERKALETAIHKLGDIYEGMEYFGSDPRSPATFDDSAVRKSDLYIGLFGDRFGSDEPNSGKSFTELEYEVARESGIPTLAYFRGSYVTGHEEPAEARFKERVRRNQLCAVFQDSRELETQFLIDLFKQIRGPLFAKLRPQLGLIPFDALHAVTRALLPEQIGTVGHDKYIPEIYIPRVAEESLAEFLHFEERTSARSTDIFDALERIAEERGLSGGAAALRGVREAVLPDEDPRRVERAIGALKEAYYFSEVEASLADLQRILSGSNLYDAASRAATFAMALQGQAYADAVRLAQLPQIVLEAVRRRATGGQGEEKAAEARSIFPSMAIRGRLILANDLVKELVLLTDQASKRCAVLVDSAGHGKTNVLCRIAERAIETHPVILLSGQMQYSAEYDIEWHIQRQLESAFGAAFADWISRSAPGLAQARRWLYVLVDGINECAELALFAQLLRQFLPKLAAKRIKLVLSCRDIYWDLFLPSLRPYLFDRPVSLSEFSAGEWESARELYFRRFEVSAQFESGAAVSLRNPLLLRFFCEAYQRQALGRVTDIHLLSVFQRYVEGIGRSIATRLGLITSDPIEAFLLRVVHAMWEDHSPAVDQARLGLSFTEMASANSLYTLIRSENVILDESRTLHSSAKVVRFVYDVFMEYLLARDWHETIMAERAVEERLLQQAMESLVTFPSALGGILFLDQMLEGGGRLVNRALAMSGPAVDVLLDSRQSTLMTAFEHMDPVSVEDELLRVIERFEFAAAEDLRPRLALVLLRLIEKNPGRAALRPVIERMLEVAPAGKEERREKPGGAAEKPSAAFTGLKDWLANSSLGDVGKAIVGIEPHKQGLPPARHHYTEETKLNAIGLIVASGDPRDYELVENGIRKLGRMDLHSALDALESLDLADEEFVYRAIESHMGTSLPEYRIYCAWLLRGRYGSKPAGFLLRLLSDQDTRVHRFTFGLFESRLIEEDLLRGVLREALPGMASWLLAYRVRLLGLRDRFASPELVKTLGPEIASILKRIGTHRLPGIRLAAYRSLTRFPEFVDHASLIATMRADAEPRLRALADHTSHPLSQEDRGDSRFKVP